jgi:peptidoglycan/LPS O-acetylase OafA/YrhL
MLLALSVVAGHFSNILGIRLIDAGVAVHLFFVVSGFYMALILTAKYQDRRIFYLNRVLRLWPTYLAVLVGGYVWFYFCWYYTGKQPPPLWVAQAYHSMPAWQALGLHAANITMVGLDIPCLFFYRPETGFLFAPFNSAPPTDAFPARTLVQIGQAWTISMEIYFYLLVPFLVRRGVAFLTFLVFTSVLLNLATDSFGLSAYFFFPGQLYLFVIGILTYRFYTSHRAAIDARPIRSVVWLCAIAGTVLVYQWVPDVVAPYFVFVVCVPAIPWLFAHFRNSRRDTELGNLSYALYLCHGVVASVLAISLHSENGTLLAVVSTIVALALNLLIEKPIDKIRQSLAARSMARPGL